MTDLRSAVLELCDKWVSNDCPMTPMESAMRDVVVEKLRKLCAQYAAPVACSQCDKLIGERDCAEEVIDALCDAVLGTDRAEWSSAYGFWDAVREVQEACARMPLPEVPKC